MDSIASRFFFQLHQPQASLGGELALFLLLLLLLLVEVVPLRPTTVLVGFLFLSLIPSAAPMSRFATLVSRSGLSIDRKICLAAAVTWLIVHGGDDDVDE